MEKISGKLNGGGGERHFRPATTRGSTGNAECRRVNCQFQDEFASSTVDRDSRIVQQHATRGMTVVDEIGYRLMRQLRSAAAGPKMLGPRRPNVASLDAVSWRKLSPSVQLMVDPTSGARAVIRHSRSGESRFLWSVLAAGEMYPVLEGRADDLAEAWSTAEAALRTYDENRLEMPEGYFVV